METGGRPASTRTRLIFTLAAAATLAACAGPRDAPRTVATPPPVAAPAEPKPAPANARAAGVAAGEKLPDPAAFPHGPAEALKAFRLSCAALLRRSDASGLTRADDWRPACEAAPGWAEAEAAIFFARFFEAVRVGDGTAFATGYFEPEIAGSRDPAPGYAVPIHRNPGDLIEADLGRWSDSLEGRKVRGRIEKGRLIPYYDRAEIDAGALAGRKLELAWAADYVDFFFLQIQGSGRLRLPDGSVMRIGYDGQNGRDYVAIGRVLRDEGVFRPGEATMQGIVDWLRANPGRAQGLMEKNKSYIFFRELTGPGPLGALGVAVTPGATVAADPAFVPLGAPVLLDAETTTASGYWIAQDTGGAIKGANRFDTFWGAGEAARATAGAMSSKGRAWLLLPVGTLARLNGGDAAARPRP